MKSEYYEQPKDALGNALEFGDKVWVVVERTGPRRAMVNLYHGRFLAPGTFVFKDNRAYGEVDNWEIGESKDKLDLRLSNPVGNEIFSQYTQECHGYSNPRSENIIKMGSEQEWVKSKGIKLERPDYSVFTELAEADNVWFMKLP